MQDDPRWLRRASVDNIPKISGISTAIGPAVSGVVDLRPSSTCCKPIPPENPCFPHHMAVARVSFVKNDQPPKSEQPETNGN